MPQVRRRGIGNRYTAEREDIFLSNFLLEVILLNFGAFLDSLYPKSKKLKLILGFYTLT